MTTRVLSSTNWVADAERPSTQRTIPFDPASAAPTDRIVAQYQTMKRPAAIRITPETVLMYRADDRIQRTREVWPSDTARVRTMRTVDMPSP